MYLSAEINNIQALFLIKTRRRAMINEYFDV